MGMTTDLLSAHINNLYNTAFWALVQRGGQTKKDAHESLRVPAAWPLVYCFYLLAFASFRARIPVRNTRYCTPSSVSTTVYCLGASAVEACWSGNRRMVQASLLVFDCQ